MKAVMKEISLMDKIIDTWASPELTKKLLEKEQTLGEIIEACQVDEKINNQSQLMLWKPFPDTINKISNWKSRPTSHSDFGRCERSGHKEDSSTCPARQTKCNRYSRLGHFGRKCRTVLKCAYPQSYEGKNVENFKRRNVRLIKDGKHEGKEINRKNCFKIYSNDEHDERIQCRIGGEDVAMIIDSGSRFNLISQDDWLTLQSRKATVFNVRTNSENQFRGYASDTILNVTGVFEAL